MNSGPVASPSPSARLRPEPGSEVFRTDGVTARLVGLADRDALQDLCVRCSDYFQLVTGAPPKATEASELLVDLPPTGHSLDDKFVIALEDPGHTLVGVLDVLRDYPASGRWYLGLMLIDPAHRGRGLGGQCVAALGRWVAGQGATVLRLGVVEQNVVARRFWSRMGFVLESTRSGVTYGTIPTTVSVLALDLTGPATEAPPERRGSR